MRLQDDRGWNEASLLREDFRSLSADFFDYLRAIYRRRRGRRTGRSLGDY